MSAAAIHYFSGTGNTQRAVKIVEATLRSAGYAVDLFRVTGRLEPTGRSYDLHVFAYPTYALDVPAIMLRYLRKMPRGHARAAVIAIFGDIKVGHPLNGYEGNALAHAVSLLRRKGYDVFFADAVGYPHSITFGLNPPEPADQEAIRRVSDARVGEMAEAVRQGRRSIKPVGLVSRYLMAAAGAMFAAIGRRALGKLYVADSACDGCGKCARTCPAGAIAIVNRVPRWSFGCEACQRCINACPRAAIQTSIVRLASLVSLQLLSIVTFIALFLIPYGTLFHDLVAGALVVKGALYGPVTALVIWAIVFVLLTRYAVDELIWLGEGTPWLQPIFQASFTRGYRRYLDPGFSPLEMMEKVPPSKK